tara:strand:+ start:111 stop:671 length:561 start_codon:yes stop_codon:yes gene_type:complete
MVKNAGGNKTKKQAKKHYSRPSNYKLRKSEDVNEIYAIVTKLYGNGRILIRCNDGIERQCVIRKKFRGRNKRDNEVSVDTLILAGRREWENKANTIKMETCDLLEVYSLHDRNELKQDSNIKWNILQTTDTQKEDVNFMDIDNIGSESESESESESDEAQAEELGTIHENTTGMDCFGEIVDINEI